MFTATISIKTEYTNGFGFVSTTFESIKRYYSFEERFKKAKAVMRSEMLEELKDYDKEDQARVESPSILYLFNRLKPQNESLKLVEECENYTQTITVSMDRLG